MVYAPLLPTESYYVEYEGDGRYKFVYCLQFQGGPAPVFSVAIAMSHGALGMFKEEVECVGGSSVSRAEALDLMRALLVPENVGTPAGAVAIRGATNFITPLNWDTMYAPIFNMIERPVAPMLSVRVETDWYAHETEFRYVLQAGEVITVQHSLPVGQVFFMPREEMTMRDCTPAEVEEIRKSQGEFARRKSEIAQRTSYGLTVSPHYLRQSRARKP